MARYKSKKKIEKNNRNKQSVLKKIAIIGAAGALAITPVVSEVTQHQKVKEIEENAEKKVPRSFKNISQEDMGKYLKAEIETLYQTYPDIDEWMYEDSPQTNDQEFIDEVYRLYKAYMVDIANKQVESIDDVKVTTVDQVIMSSDLIQEEREDGTVEEIMKTYKEQYKEMTNSYVSAKEGKSSGAELGKEIYELLALELGLDSKTATSEKIEEQIQNKGFYYDESNNVFYTSKGKADLVSRTTEENIQEIQNEKEKQIENDGFEH